MIEYQEDVQVYVERPIRTVQLERYEYSIYYRRGKYYVKCKDSEKKSMEHGPMTQEQANTMIDSRIWRHDDTKS